MSRSSDTRVRWLWAVFGSIAALSVLLISVAVAFILFAVNYLSIGGPEPEVQTFPNDGNATVSLRDGQRQVIYVDALPDTSGMRCSGVGDDDAALTFTPVPYSFLYGRPEHDYNAVMYVEASRDGRYQIRCTGGNSYQDFGVGADSRIAGGAYGSWTVILSPVLLGFALGAAIALAVSFRRPRKSKTP